jgi:hypothetical protein
MSLGGTKFEAIAAVERSGAEMSAGTPARISLGHHGAVCAIISAPESS